MKRCLFVLALPLAAAIRLTAADIPVGKIVDVTCAADDSQSYALYLPARYTPDREWKLILAFDAGARGRQGVERFEAAAEKYGYIVAGSNNSRNGPWDVSMNAADAMATDVLKRFKVDWRHMYTTGQSGGARVAMKVAMETGNIAGVVASSAGFPDPGEPERKLSFPVYGTAGTEDFNYSEMRTFDNELTSPHHIEIFEGVHTWLSSELAMKAVEWMEIEAMKSGISPRNPAFVKTIFDKRLAEANGLKSDFARYRALNAMATDFRSVADVSAIDTQTGELRKHKDVEEAAKADARILQTEALTTRELYDAVRSYTESPASGIKDLRSRVMKLFEQAQAPADTDQRRLARRVLAGLRAGSRGIQDKDYQKLIAEIQLAPRPN
jgi:poly(3-hydroxybutyrate) depolymerase